jgi:hypothetical protein
MPDEGEAIANGDVDASGVVDLDHYAGWADCRASPGQPPAPPTPECANACLGAFDFDVADRDVDLRNFAEFQEVFKGSLPRAITSLVFAGGRMVVWHRYQPEQPDTISPPGACGCGLPVSLCALARSAIRCQ